MTTQATTGTIKRAAGICQVCGFVNVVEGETTRMSCGGCGKRVRLAFLRALYNGRQPCNGECLYATGPNCSCSCAGTNHMAGYLGMTVVPVWVRDRDRTRHEAKQQRAQEKKRAAQQERLDQANARRAELLGEWPILAELDDASYAGHRSTFLANMHHAWVRGYMTDPMASKAAQVLDEERQRRADEEEREQRARDAAARGEQIRGGRTTFTCRILSVKDRESRFAYGKREWNMRVETTHGWRLFGPLPAELMPARGSYDWDAQLRGRVVTLAANIKPKDGDPLFGFFRSPSVVDADAEWPDTPDAPTPVLAPASERAPERAGAGVPEGARTRYPWGKLIKGLTSGFDKAKPGGLTLPDQTRQG